MVVDTSALMAIVLREPERNRFSTAILSTSDVSMSAATWVEAMIVADRRLPAAEVGEFEALLTELRIAVVPLSLEHAALARAAYKAFGLHSPLAALNYGDCFSYALSKHLRQPLLFKGNDFSKTDIVPALA